MQYPQDSIDRSKFGIVLLSLGPLSLVGQTLITPLGALLLTFTSQNPYLSDGKNPDCGDTQDLSTDSLTNIHMYVHRYIRVPAQFSFVYPVSMTCKGKVLGIMKVEIIAGYCEATMFAI